MGLDVYWTQFAESKLDDIYIYYKLNAGQQIALKLINGIVDATLKLGEFPKSGPIEMLLASRQEEFRYLVYKNYKIIYWINLNYNRVEVANVFDSRQNPVKMNLTE